MLNELTEFYIPDKILHRDEQLDKIREVFKRFKELGTAKNLLIQGFSGSGKTACINKVLSEQDNHYIYVSGSKQITSTQILKAITDLTFNTRERLLSEAIMMFRKNPHIIIIDEINKLKRVEEIRWLFNDLNTLYRETGCPIIIITNMREILKIPDHDALNTLFFRIVELKPYNALEMKDIIEDRIELIRVKYGKEIKFSKEFDILSYISAVSVNEAEGSARMALSLIKECIIIGEFTKETVDKIVEEMKESEWREVIDCLPKVERRFLALLIELAQNKSLIPIGDIIRRLKEYPPSRVSQMINSLERYFIIERAKSNTDKRMINVRFVSKELLQKLEPLIKEVIPL